MSDASTARLIEAYVEESEAPTFLAGFFRSPPENFHNTEKVEIDIQRDDEDVAVVVQDLSVGARNNESTLYVNKAFTPPIYKEKITISAYKTMARQPGVDPFKDPVFGANAVKEAFRGFRKIENKIKRAIEWMASQVFQTGALTLIDATGASLYTLNFQPKASHMATVSTAWAVDGSTGDPLADLEALAIVTRRDGKKNPNKLVFGTSAWQRFMANAKVRERGITANNSTGLLKLEPSSRGMGATFMGFAWIGQYRMELWTYDGFFRHPQSGAHTPYISADNVLMISEAGRLDLSFGAIPRIVAPDPRAMPFLPPRISDGERGIDLTVNSWIEPDGENVCVSAGTRPLTIPTAIDTFARLDVTP
jgi:hypothetical protein